jgi:phosphoenolpyruvate-protein kinase (PTS system EI component)
LQRGIHDATANNICLLTHQELGVFETRPAGVIVIDGAPFSHPMIRLLVRGIPTVMVSANTASSLEQGKEIFIDGFAGKILQPVQATLAKTPEPEPPPAGEALSLTDGSEVLLRASIFSTGDATRAVNKGAASIGLVRTEYMIPDNGRLPDAAFYSSSLGALCDAAQPLKVTLRLPDITQDKPVPWFKQLAGFNTPLGMQGVRLFDKEPVREVVFAMLDAVNRLSDTYEISLLLPYVTKLEEFHRWHNRIEQCLHKPLLIGTMAESPVALLAMPHWFEHADFVAIGCNDLMQCVFAADRDLAEMRGYLDAYSPELHRFLQQAADAAGDNINRVQLCGLLPQMPGVLPVLIGMGFRVFSVAPVMIPYLANTINGINLAQAQALARQACEARDSREVRELL